MLIYISVKPGVMYREVGDVISRVVHKKGFSVVRAYVGHGVGRLFHCAPNVPHYASIFYAGFFLTSFSDSRYASSFSFP